MGAGPLEDFFCALNFITVFGVNRDKNIALLDLAFVLLGFVFWYPHSDQCTGKAANCSTDARPGKVRRWEL